MHSSPSTWMRVAKAPSVLTGVTWSAPSTIAPARPKSVGLVSRSLKSAAARLLSF